MNINTKVNIILIITTILLFLAFNKAFWMSEYMNFEEEFTIQQQKELEYFKTYDKEIFSNEYILDNIDLPLDYIFNNK